MSQSVSAKNLPLGKLFPFMEYRHLFVGISLLAVALSLFVVFGKGLNFGVDFKGGSKIIYKFSDKITDGQIRTALEPLQLGDVQVVAFGKEAEQSFMIKVKQIEGKSVGDDITKALKASFGADKMTTLSEESVGPKVGADLRRKGLMAMLLTWALILLYVGFRFDFLFAPGALVALLHDVIVTAGLFAFFGKEFNLPILAALLTIMGYSVNDTIIIYDRVRENVHKLDKHIKLSDLINISVNETLSRTIVTSLTVLFVVLVLFFFGGAVLEDFAFCMIVGVIAGSYSTIFVASPIYLYLQRLWPKKGLAQNRLID